MTFDLFLSSPDTHRACRVFERLAHHNLRGFALTGSLALEIGMMSLGQTPQARALHDVDLVLDSLSAISPSLTDDFLCRHIHPRAPEGKMLIQLVDPRDALRIDIFRPYGATLARCYSVDPLQVVSLEDLTARVASLVMDLERGSQVPRKHADDFQRLAHAINPDRIEAAWQDHRNPADPPTFQEAFIRIRNLVASRAHLLVTPDYSHDADTVCPKCEQTPPFRLAPAHTILSILGYC